MKNFYVYILTNGNNRVLYTGVSNNLERRIFEHKSKKVEGFTKKYNVDKLVFYENYYNSEDAIRREKQIKGWVREKKNKLVEKENPNWNEILL